MCFKYNTKEKGRKTIVVISGELEQKMEKKSTQTFLRWFYGHITSKRNRQSWTKKVNPFFKADRITDFLWPFKEEDCISFYLVLVLIIRLDINILSSTSKQ